MISFVVLPSCAAIVRDCRAPIGRPRRGPVRQHPPRVRQPSLLGPTHVLTSQSGSGHAQIRLRHRTRTARSPAGVSAKVTHRRSLARARVPQLPQCPPPPPPSDPPGSAAPRHPPRLASTPRTGRHGRLTTDVFLLQGQVGYVPAARLDDLHRCRASGRRIPGEGGHDPPECRGPRVARRVLGA